MNPTRCCKSEITPREPVSRRGSRRKHEHNAGLKVDNGHLRPENAITLYAIVRRGGKVVRGGREEERREREREKERRRGRSRFTHTKSQRARAYTTVIKPINPRHNQPLTQILYLFICRPGRSR